MNIWLHWRKPSTIICIFAIGWASSAIAAESDPWPTAPPVIPLAIPSESGRQELENYRGSLEQRREVMERQRGGGEIDSERYREDLEKYREGMKEYQRGIEPYRRSD